MREFYRWRGTVIQQVRFRAVRAKIAEELDAYYEDHVKNLERMGFEHGLVEQRVLQVMGDAMEVGRAMDKAHKVWLDRYGRSAVLPVCWPCSGGRGSMARRSRRCCIGRIVAKGTGGTWYSGQEIFSPPRRNTDMDELR